MLWTRRSIFFLLLRPGLPRAIFGRFQAGPAKAPAGMTAFRQTLLLSYRFSSAAPSDTSLAGLQGGARSGAEPQMPHSGPRMTLSVR